MTKWTLASRSIKGLRILAGMVALGSLEIGLSQTDDPVYFRYSAESGWAVGNDQFRARFEHRADGTFHWIDFADASGARVWKGTAASSPFNLRIDNNNIDENTPLKLIGQRGYTVRNGGRAVAITFRDDQERYELELHLRIHAGHPILSQQVKVRNLGPGRAYIRADNLLPYALETESTDYRVFRVNQWSTLNADLNSDSTAAGRNFETMTSILSQASQKVTMATGAGGFQCAWFALRKTDDAGLIAGWEFDGLAEATVERREESVALSVSLSGLTHPVEPQEWYEAPAAFIGIFAGDWDEAGYRTQRYASKAIARQVSDPNFPYVVWDSWGYGTTIDERILRREADLAAATGVELFVVDLGWAKRIGDWEEDREKFPSGLRAFSDYVHNKGMKFGLHFVISEAMADSKVLREHPDWACSTNYNYHGAQSLALGHKAVQDWVIEQGVRMIQDFNVDWILQDGQTMVKQCMNRDLSYDYRDWNYAGDYGLNRILEGIQSRTPGTLWENCANGGNMMTFRMVRNYATSITNDASGPLGARQGLYGASFPFPPQYTDRYMPAGPMTDYNTRSFIFGGPWILMNRLTELTGEELAFLRSEIRTYKAMRQSIGGGKILHLTARPAEGRVDAIQSYNPLLDEAIAVVVRDGTENDRYTLRLRDLMPERAYYVSFQDDTKVFVMTGEQLMLWGVSVNLPERESGEIVYARPVLPPSGDAPAILRRGRIHPQ